MPRPRSLTTTDLATAALAIIDRYGLSALTMRAVAKHLHMATMALYRYVSTRDDLEVLVVEQILGPIDVSLPPNTPWQERATILLDRIRTAVSAHPAAVPLVLRHRQSSPTALRWIEAMLTVLTNAGFTGHDRVIAQRTVIGFLLGSLQNEHYASITGTGTSTIADLPTDQFPLLVQTAAQARTISADEEFHRGLDIVLRGLTHHAGHPPR